MLQGIFTALATPFTTEGQIDFSALERLLLAQLAAGVHGIVLLGTTAETPTLSLDEKKQILDFCMPRLQGKCQVIIGTGSNDTATTVANTELAATYQPDAVLVVTPYYNKPNPAGLVAHYQRVAQVGVPVILYHIPGRTGLKVPQAVLTQLLQEVPQIVGIKESDYDSTHVMQTAVSYHKQLAYLCGNDDLFPQYLAINAAGIISAAANVFAPAFVQIYTLFKQGQAAQSFELFSQLYPLIKACYAETNPTCIKYMLAQRGFGTAHVRLPLGAVSSDNQARLDTLLKTANPQWMIS